MMASTVTDVEEGGHHRPLLVNLCSRVSLKWKLSRCLLLEISRHIGFDTCCPPRPASKAMHQYYVDVGCLEGAIEWSNSSVTETDPETRRQKSAYENELHSELPDVAESDEVFIIENWNIANRFVCNNHTNSVQPWHSSFVERIEDQQISSDHKIDEVLPLWIDDQFSKLGFISSTTAKRLLRQL